MNWHPGLILLQAPPSDASPFALPFVPIILIFGIFYFLLIRPQQKRQKQKEAMIKGIEKADAIVTSGGLHGKVTGVTDDVLTIEIAVMKSDRVRVKVSRAHIETVTKAGKADAA